MVQKKFFGAKKKGGSVSEVLNKAPEGILILTFVLFAASMMTLSFSVWMLTAADEFVANKAAYAQAYQGLNISENTFINFGIFSLVLSILLYLVGRGLVKLDNRARIVLLVMILVILGSSIYNMIQGTMFFTSIFLIIGSGVVIWYITARKTVAHFKK